MELKTHQAASCAFWTSAYLLSTEREHMKQRLRNWIEVILDPLLALIARIDAEYEQALNDGHPYM